MIAKPTLAGDPLLWALGGLGVALVVFITSASLTLSGAIAEGRVATTAMLSQAYGVIGDQLQTMRERSEAADEGRVATTVPALIEQVGDLANANGVLVKTIAAIPDSQTSLALHCAAPFPAITSFMTALENVGAAISELELTRPKAESADIEAVFIVYAHGTPPGAPKMSDELMAERAGHRNPFARQALVAAGAAAEGLVDVSNRYTLMAITSLGLERQATINNRDYEIGDTLDQHRIAAILADRVILQPLENTEAPPQVILLQ